MLSGVFKSATSSLKGLTGAITAPAKAAVNLGGALVGGLGKLGMAGLGIGVVADSAKGLAGALGIGLNAELETLRAQFLAITKDAAGTDKMLASFQTRADKSPFGLVEVAKAGAMLLPAAKQAKMGLDPLLDTAQLLAAINPAEGLEGAAFSLREALSGDFVSIVERFNLPRKRLNELKAQGVPAVNAINTVLKEMGIDMSIVTAMGETFTGRLNTLDDTIKGFRRTLSAPLFEELKAGIIIIQGFLDRNKESINAWATTWGKRIGGAAHAAIAGIEAIIKAIQSLTHFFATGELFEDSAFIQFARGLGIARDAALTFSGAIRGDWGGMVSDDINPVVRAFGMFGLTIRKAIGIVAPFIPAIESLGKAIANIVKGNAGIGLFISEFERLFGIDISSIVGRFQILFVQIGAIIRKAAAGDIGGAVQALLDLVVGARLDLIEAVGTWAAAFINWLTPHIPAILNAVGQVVLAIGNWIQTRGPEIQARLMGWVAAFTNWVAPMIPPLLAQLQLVIDQITAWITTNAPIFLERFLTKWLPAFVDWLADAGEAALPHLTAFLDRVVAWVSTSAAPLLEAFIAHWTPKLSAWLVDAAKQIIPRLIAFQAEIIKWIATEGVPAFIQMGLDLGSAIIMGLIQALNTAKDQIRNALIAAGVPLPGQPVPTVPPGAITQRPPVPAVTERPPVAPTSDPMTQAKVLAMEAQLTSLNAKLLALNTSLDQLNPAIAQTPAAFKTAASQLIGPY